ncbi:hypothetical protein ABT158_37105 [Nonomuraea sp. NPDC001636]|uniref:hypothetical protein n=1 Tax=Nonomuraea sp. NPDC001636 TaxID=3154391 RepID=UPI0033309A6F
MRERADQMVLNYVSRAADAAERRGSQDARDVAKVPTRFGAAVRLHGRRHRLLDVR